MPLWFALILGFAAVAVLQSGMYVHAMRVLLLPRTGESAPWVLGLYAGAWLQAALLAWFACRLVGPPAVAWTDLGASVLGGVTLVVCISHALAVLGPSRHICARTGLWAALQPLRTDRAADWDAANLALRRLAVRGAACGVFTVLAWLAADGRVAGAVPAPFAPGVVMLQSVALAVALAASVLLAKRAAEVLPVGPPSADLASLRRVSPGDPDFPADPVLMRLAHVVRVGRACRRPADRPLVPIRFRSAAPGAARPGNSRSAASVSSRSRPAARRRRLPPARRR